MLLALGESVSILGKFVSRTLGKYREILRILVPELGICYPTLLIRFLSSHLMDRKVHFLCTSLLFASGTTKPWCISYRSALLAPDPEIENFLPSSFFGKLAGCGLSQHFRRPIGMGFRLEVEKIAIFGQLLSKTLKTSFARAFVASETVTYGT